MANQKIKIDISASARSFNVAMRGVMRKLRVLRNVVSRVGTGMRKAFMSRRMFAPMIASVTLLGFALKKSFQFETYQITINKLLGSVHRGAKRFAVLKKLAATTPFELENVIKASRTLTIFSRDVLGGEKSLRMVGDAAALTNQNVEEVAFWFGRAYNAISADRPMGRAALRLQEMGILSGETRTQLEGMQKAGGNVQARLALLNRDFRQFEGGMAAVQGTGEQLMSNLHDVWSVAMATFGDEIATLAKEGLVYLMDTMQRLSSDGSIKRWGQRTNAVLIQTKKVMDSLLFGDIDQKKEGLKSVGAVLKDSFLLAALSAYKVLLENAPKIGQAIGQAIKDAFPWMEKGAKAREIAMNASPIGFVGYGKRTDPLRPAWVKGLEKRVFKGDGAGLEEQLLRVDAQIQTAADNLELGILRGVKEWQNMLSERSKPQTYPYLDNAEALAQQRIAKRKADPMGAWFQENFMSGGVFDQLLGTNLVEKRIRPGGFAGGIPGGEGVLSGGKMLTAGDILARRAGAMVAPRKQEPGHGKSSPMYVEEVNRPPEFDGSA